MLKMCVDAYDNQYFSSDDPSAAVPHHMLVGANLFIRCVRVVSKCRLER
jgi:hypothetical protein